MPHGGSFGSHLELISKRMAKNTNFPPEPDNKQKQINPLFHIILTPGIDWKGH